MFCGKCGNEILVGDEFCGKCGNKIDTEIPVSSIHEPSASEEMNVEQQVAEPELSEKPQQFEKWEQPNPPIIKKKRKFSFYLILTFSLIILTINWQTSTKN